MVNERSIEKLILDWRCFLDEALTFVEFYESTLRNCKQFTTSHEEISQLRSSSIEFTRLVCDLKKILLDGPADSSPSPSSSSSIDEQNGVIIDEFNVALEYSNGFKKKRIVFFRRIFERLNTLYKRVYMLPIHKSNVLLRLYFNTLRSLCNKSNELIGYLESRRWDRTTAVQILDKLIGRNNDFSCVFEKLVQLLDAQNCIVATRVQIDSCLVSLASIRSLISTVVRHWCPCVSFGVVILVLVLVAILSERSTHQDEYETLNLLNYIDVQSYFDEKLKSNSINRQLDQTFYELSWNQILNYMKKFHVVCLSLTAFVSLEWFANY